MYRFEEYEKLKIFLRAGKVNPSISKVGGIVADIYTLNDVLKESAPLEIIIKGQRIAFSCPSQLTYVNFS